ILFVVSCINYINTFLFLSVFILLLFVFCFFFFFFFFQAEDGIRDYKVTGVQTCALPISTAAAHATSSARIVRGQPPLRRTSGIELKRRGTTATPAASGMATSQTP